MSAQPLSDGTAPPPARLSTRITAGGTGRVLWLGEPGGTNPDEPDPDLDRCPHGKTAGEHCPVCDDEDENDVVDWRPIDPRVLMKLPVLFRCPTCGALVLDIDRCLHTEHHAAA